MFKGFFNKLKFVGVSLVLVVCLVLIPFEDKLNKGNDFRIVPKAEAMAISASVLAIVAGIIVATGFVFYKNSGKNLQELSKEVYNNVSVAAKYAIYSFGAGTAFKAVSIPIKVIKAVKAYLKAKYGDKDGDGNTDDATGDDVKDGVIGSGLSYTAEQLFEYSGFSFNYEYVRNGYLDEAGLYPYVVYQINHPDLSTSYYFESKYDNLYTSSYKTISFGYVVISQTDDVFTYLPTLTYEKCYKPTWDTYKYEYVTKSLFFGGTPSGYKPFTVLKDLSPSNIDVNPSQFDSADNAPLSINIPDNIEDLLDKTFDQIKYVGDSVNVLSDAFYDVSANTLHLYDTVSDVASKLANGGYTIDGDTSEWDVVDEDLPVVIVDDGSGPYIGVYTDDDETPQSIGYILKDGNVGNIDDIVSEIFGDPPSITPKPSPTTGTIVPVPDPDNPDPDPDPDPEPQPIPTTIPEMPEYQWPEMPKYEFPEMPKYEFPEMPKYEFPEAPDLTETAKDLVTVPDGYYEDVFNDIKTTFDDKTGGDYYLDMFNKLSSFSGGIPDPIYYTDYFTKETYVLIDWAFFLAYRDKYYSILRGLIFILMIIFSYNQIHKLIRNSTGVGDTGTSRDSCKHKK